MSAPKIGQIFSLETLLTEKWWLCYIILNTVVGIECALEKNPKLFCLGLSYLGGGGEIRTHGGLSTHDGFQDRCIKPLCHTSVF